MDGCPSDLCKTCFNEFVKYLPATQAENGTIEMYIYYYYTKPSNFPILEDKMQSLLNIMIPEVPPDHSE